MISFLMFFARNSFRRTVHLSSSHCFYKYFFSKTIRRIDTPPSYYHYPLTFYFQSFHTSTHKMSPTQSEKDHCKNCGHKEDEVEGEHNEWKFREPYKVQENSGDFKALYEGGCHCGRVKYQLSREKPLDAKFCHCTTCQVLHGLSNFPISYIPAMLCNTCAMIIG
jgi:hypothetical protein